VPRRINKSDYQHGHEQSGLSLLIFLDKSQITNPFSLNSSQNTPTCIHWSLNRNNSCIHKSVEQIISHQNSHLAFHENFQRAQAFWLPCIHQRLDTYESLALTTSAWPSCWRSERNCNNLAKFLKKNSSLHSSKQLSTTLCHFPVCLSLSPICIANDLVWTFPLSAHHRLLSSCHLPSFHLPSSIELHPSASLALPLPCTP